jgi:hypothetical protein
MFTPRDFQLRISRRRTNQKHFLLSRFRNRETPRFCKTRIRPTQLPEAGAHERELCAAVLSNRSTTLKLFLAET